MRENVVEGMTGYDILYLCNESTTNANWSYELTPAKSRKTDLPPSPVGKRANPGAVQAQRPGFYLWQQIERLR